MEFIFAEKFSDQKNITVAFRTYFPAGDYVLKICAGDVFRIFLNQDFIGYGPMRTAHGYAILSEIPFKADKEKNFLTVEVAAYNINSYSTLHQHPFFGAEIFDESGKKQIKASDFSAYLLTDRIQKVSRYSMQRTFGEAYRMKASREKFYLGEDFFPQVEVCEVSRLILLDNPLSQILLHSIPAMFNRRGNVELTERNSDYDDVRFYANDKLYIDGYTKNELEVNLLYEAERLSFDRKKQGEYFDFCFENNVTGFLQVPITVKEKSVVYLVFDELYPIIPWRLTAVNVIKYELAPGEYNLLSFEPYTCKYCRVVVFGGANVEGGFTYFVRE